MTFGQMAEDEPRIATYKAKWDDAYRKRWGIKNHSGKDPGTRTAEPTLTIPASVPIGALNIRSYAAVWTCA